jgi:hypothetical protein
MPGKPTPAAGLARLLLDALGRCKAAGPDGYPVRVRDLAAGLADPSADEALLIKAVKDKAFTAEAVVAVAGRADAPVALKGDEDRLSESPLTLEAALAAKGAKGKPPWLPKALAGVVAEPLRSRFQQAIEGRIAARALPPFAAVETKGKSAKLYHRDNPPPEPPPPPPPKDAVLAGRLLELLQAERSAGRYPVPVRRLAELAGVSPDDGVFKKAAKHPTFLGGVVLATWKRITESPVALTEDAGELVGSESLLGYLIDLRKGAGEAHAVAVKDLVSALDDPKPRVKNPLKEHLQKYLESADLDRHLPTGIGFVGVRNGAKPGIRHFFRLIHLHAGRAAGERAAPVPPPAATRPDFAAAFDAVFDRLDRAAGGYNFVSLVDLRAAFPDVPRDLFDAELLTLRRARRYSLNSAEGYDGIRPEERDAAIREEGELLLHVSRVRS